MAAAGAQSCETKSVKGGLMCRGFARRAVAELSTEVGEWITPAPPGVPIPPVIDLLDQKALFISAPIDEVDAERVQVGQQARITVDSRPNFRFDGRVSRVAPYVFDDLEQNRTVEVEVEFSDVAAAAGTPTLVVFGPHLTK